MLAETRDELDDAEAWCRKSLAIEEALGNRPGMAVSYGQLVGCVIPPLAA